LDNTLAITPCKSISLKSITLKQWAQIHTFGKGKDACGLSRHIRSGNKKVPRTTALFNFSSATDCMSKRLGLCAADKAGCKCYAKKSENKMRKAVLPFRRGQEAYWKTITAEQFVSDFILINSLKGNAYTSLRFSEAGDFHSQDEVEKAEKIALLLNRFGIKVYCYSSRSDLSFKNCKHLIVSGSGFMKEGISNIFQIIKNKKDKPSGYSLCKGNCRVCNWCQIRGKKICVLAH
jgi:hypothetical protein